MASTNNIEVVLPPPSQDLSKYKPFPPSFDAIVDEILSEEASFDLLGDEDWPVTSACTSEKSFNTISEHVATPTSETKTPAAKSPYFSPYTVTSNSAEMAERTRPRTRAATRRRIAVVDMASEGEEEPVPTMDDHPDWNGDVDSVMDENSTHSRVVGPPDESVEPGNDTAELENGDNEPAALPSPKTDNDGDIEPDDPEDEAEEDVIFASVGQSKGDDIIQYVGAHKFFKTPVQPVSRSARLQFTVDLRGMAASAGMPDKAINGLLDYVRRIYLDAAGAPAGSLDNPHEITFGEEIDDTPKEVLLPQKTLKRSLDQIDGTSPKKRKTDKRRSSRDANPSVQPVVQVEDSQGINGADTRIHISPEELRQERIGFTGVMDGPDRIPESPILAASPPAKTQEQARAVPEIIDLTCESDKEQIASNKDKSHVNEPLQRLSVALEESLVMSPQGIEDKGTALDGDSLDPNDLNPLDLMDIEPEAESEKGRETNRIRHGSRKYKKNNKKLSLLNSQTNPDSEPQSELQSTIVPSEISEQKEEKTERKTMKNRRKRDKKRLNRRDRMSDLGIIPNKQAMTPPRQSTPAHAPVPSTPASQKSSNSKSGSQYGQLSPDPSQWDMGF